MKTTVYLLFFIVFGLVTFFGLGPVLYADGTDQERMITLFIVLTLYALLAIILRVIRRRMK